MTRYYCGKKVLPYFEDLMDVVTLDWIYDKTAPVDVTKKKWKLAEH